MAYRLLEYFEGIFQGKPYRHRSSQHGDSIARRFYEDLYSLSRSEEFKKRVDSAEHVVNVKNKVVGKKARRGDGTFGEGVPYEVTFKEPGFNVSLGKVAQLEIAVEVKILQKAMIKQIDRVQNDLVTQAEIFKSNAHRAITVAFVGVNHANETTSYEKDRTYLAKGPQSPATEGPKAIARIGDLGRKYDELMFLRFKITNVSPFPFEWVNRNETSEHYGALLLRVLRDYEQRFTT